MEIKPMPTKRPDVIVTMSNDELIVIRDLLGKATHSIGMYNTIIEYINKGEKL